jgi:very-short-patch-repair endonuclease
MGRQACKNMIEAAPIPVDNSEQPLHFLVKFDAAINYAFQQNAIPILNEFRLLNDSVERKELRVHLTTEPAFSEPLEMRIQSLQAGQEFCVAPLDLKLKPEFLASLTERIAGLLRIRVTCGDDAVSERTEPIALLARNEWCGLASLPEILAAFVLPNDPAVMTVLDRAAKILKSSTGRSALNGYQDKSRKRVWEQMAAIYKAIAELGIRYINPPASFQATGQKVRFPSDIVSQRFGTCLDLTLMVAACAEQSGLHPVILMHDGHAYAGCWLDEKTFDEPAMDELRGIRRLLDVGAVTVFETTALTSESPSSLTDAELLAKAHVQDGVPFKMAIDVRRSRIAKILPLPIEGVSDWSTRTAGPAGVGEDTGIGDREIVDPLIVEPQSKRAISRIDHWKSKLLDLSLRNRLLNFKPTKATIPILCAVPEQVEDELAANVELTVLPRPKLMGSSDPRDPATYLKQQRSDALAEHLRDELKHKRLRTGLEEPEHATRLTELYRAARLAMEENGSNTLFAAVGMMEWRETEHSERILRAPILLVPVELKRKSVIEGFTLRRIDEETRLNVTLMEMLRQNFHKEIPGLDPLPEDATGVDVAKVFQIFREATVSLRGWEVKTDIWLGQFSFAKFLLWKDLSDRIEQLAQNRIVKHLIEEGGSPFQNPSDDIKPTALDDQFHPRDIYCPRSADSSQLAAVMAAAAGHDFVLEGPPGTGKSQTIANIIAHCLGTGKRVLFVAEKRAALDVVHRRLKEEKLDPFCLELHSNKTGKGEVLGQLDQSLKFSEDSIVADWDERANELAAIRDSLNSYTRTLHAKQPCGLSAYSCYDYLLPRREEETVTLGPWDDVTAITREELQDLREVSRLLQERTKPLGNLASHVFGPIQREEWSPLWGEATLEKLRNVRMLIAPTRQSFSKFANQIGYESAVCSWSTFENAWELAPTLLDCKPLGPDFATVPWLTQAMDLDRWAKLAVDRRQLRQESEALVNGLDFEKWSEEQANEFYSRASDVQLAVANLHSQMAPLTKLLEYPGGSRGGELQALADLCSVLQNAEVVGYDFVRAEWKGLSDGLNQWASIAQERALLRQKISSFDETALLALDLTSLRARWRTSRASWFLPKLLGASAVQGALRKAKRDGGKTDPLVIDEVLTSAVRVLEINRAFAHDSQIAERCLGMVWGSGEPNPETLLRVRSWGDSLNQRIAVCAAVNPSGESKFRDSIAVIVSKRIEPGIFREFCEKWETLRRSVSELTMRLQFKEASFPGSSDYLEGLRSNLKQTAVVIARLRAISVQFLADTQIGTARLAGVWNSGEPDSDQLASVKAWGDVLHRQILALAGGDQLTARTVQTKLASLFATQPSAFSREGAARDAVKDLLESWGTFKQAYARFQSELVLDDVTVKSSLHFAEKLSGLLTEFEKHWPQLFRWCSWRQIRAKAVTGGLASVVQKLEQSSSFDVPALFERSFRRMLLYALIEKERVLRQFIGNEHQDRIKQFRKVDVMVAGFARQIIRARLAARIPREHVNFDVPKTEIGLLRKEIGKKARQIPVRQLLNRIPNLLPRLKPCVLMSPLSVAQYLEASHETFDVVVFDEASQIPVWDAVGAIARGKQLIVVGDPKQLPPTNFFGRSDDPEEDALVELQDLESILDELLSQGLRHKRLQWHYRSRHEGLIAFSNRQYYENELLTFPAPSIEPGGVRLRQVPQAFYDKGKSRTNLAEARALVAELISRLRDTLEKKSFGVVTFSQAQQQLVENLLDEERRKHPEIESHFGDAPPVEGEPVFIKNLENVQGDERDVIMFSICYGPDEAGKLSMNFGPLNREGGERRLNVAITRAKYEVIVFSGLRADQIDLSRSRARGVRDLKFFLEYAERGPKALLAAVSASSSEGDAESEFERLVAGRLRAAGYDVHHQIGCSGYRVDLGVVDPKRPGRYLLGIECDGATYHRAATARDRDKLRQAVLEGLGWKLHRIWSTDWWHDSDTELQKVVQRIQELSAGESRAAP